MNDGTIIASTVTFSQMMEPSHARRTEKFKGARAQLTALRGRIFG